MLRNCKSYTEKEKAFFRQEFKNCNTEDNIIGGRLKGKKRMAVIKAACCAQVACHGPEALGLPCKDKKLPPQPHFGDIRPENYSYKYVAKGAGMGVL